MSKDQIWAFFIDQHDPSHLDKAVTEVWQCRAIRSYAEVLNIFKAAL